MTTLKYQEENPVTETKTQNDDVETPVEGADEDDVETPEEEETEEEESEE